MDGKAIFRYDFAPMVLPYSGPWRTEGAEDIYRMIEGVAASCVAAYRYCGTDPEILRRLVKAGYKDNCDALVQRRHDGMG